MGESAKRGYLGNPLLKKSGQRINWTAKRLKEWMKCKEDPIYFINKYYKIVTLDQGLVTITLRDYQEEFIELIHGERFVISKQARQMGKTDSVAGYICWYLIFNDDVQVGILAHKSAGAREVLSRIQTGYEHLPDWLQQGVVEWNKGNFELENGSKVITSASTGGAIRGKTCNIVIIDEAAFLPQNMAEEFFTSIYPTITSGTTSKMILISTPNGMNHFYKMYKAAESGKSNYKALSIPWFRHPERDEKWKEETIANTSQQQFTQEYDIEFMGSAKTLIDAKTMQGFIPSGPMPGNAEDPSLRIYEYPANDPEAKYMLIADTGHGLGADYSAFQVIRVDQVPYVQVATYANNTIDPGIYPNIIFQVAKYYNEAWVAIELNDIGHLVSNILVNELEYENIIKTKKSNKGFGTYVLAVGDSIKYKKGITTSVAVKKNGCLNIKTLIENNKLILHDEDTQMQFHHFVPIKSSFAAEEGYNDDLIMPLVLFGWIQKQAGFKEIFGEAHSRNSLYSGKISEVENSMVPAIYISSGTGDTEIVDPQSEDFVDGFLFKD